MHAFNGKLKLLLFGENVETVSGTRTDYRCFSHVWYTAITEYMMIHFNETKDLMVELEIETNPIRWN